MSRALHKGQRVEVTFTGYDEDGRAVGTGPGDVEVRVPGGVRGERAEVKIAHVSPHQDVAWAHLRRVIEASPLRLRDPGAPGHVCGGCPFAHLHAEEELAVKRGRLEALARGCPEATLGQPVVLSAPGRTGYRNRAKYVVGQRNGRVVLGGYLPRSHHVVGTVGCPVTDPAVAGAAAALEASLGQGPWPAYDEARGEGTLRYAGVRVNHAGQVLLTLVTAREPEPPLDSLVASLREQVPGLHGVTLDVNDTPGNVIFSGRERVLWGEGTLLERYGPARVRLSGHGFGQVNRDQAARLFDGAARAALAPLPGGASPQRIWELFAGTGALTQVIAHTAAGRGVEVVGVERDETAVRLARQAVTEQALAGIRFEAADARAWLAADRASAPPDVLVLDPPRAGCRSPLRQALIRLAPPRIVYVSCSVRTLGRDLAALREGGYAVRSLQGVDLMPLTPHLEVLAVLERAAP